VPDLTARLQTALGTAYLLEHELGGGGMSRVFRGTDTRLGRPIVVKVLPPDLGAGLNIARFQREISVAAKLQHPHIVPLLTAGAQDDLLYYIMPYIDGQSLRVRLGDARPITMAETMRILREVADALAYAHAQGIVHRDIKPGNVLLSGKHAFVTDFGVAKALEESTGPAMPMTVGVALGTPAYMAPEQAAADPTIDHRADIYALGALSYEMITGRPPFTGPSVQAVVAAHLTTPPVPVTTLRADVPPALAHVVMRCLAKEPADRWQSANEVLEQLELMVTPPTGGITSAPAPASRPKRRFRIAALALAVLLLGTAGFFVVQALGLGRAGTLLASGVLEPHDRLVLAQFDNRTSDSTLGPSVSEAFRVDLAQSPSVRLLDQAAMGAALQRMNRPAGSRIDLSLARDMAQREGAKAVVRGQIDPVGSGYMLTAELVSAADGTVLVALRENARDDGGLIDAVDRLSKRLRRRIGESLKTIRASEPLERVTTGSLEALRLYSQAVQADTRGEWDRAIALLDQAIALDTGFAMAYRKLAVELFNTFGAPSRMNAASTNAFRHRDRLPPLERHMTTAWYYSRVEFDRDKTEQAYRAALDVDPDNFPAANNLTQLLNDQRRFAAAESVGLRHLDDPSFAIHFNVAGAELGLGKLDDAAAVARAYELKAPGNPAAVILRAFVDENRESYDSAEGHIRSLNRQSLDLSTQGWQTASLFALAQVRGRLGAAAAEGRRAMDVSERRGLPGSYLGGAVQLATMQLRFEQSPALARRTVAAALARHPLATIPVEDRPYDSLIMFLAEAGDVDRARRLLVEYEAAVPEGIRRSNTFRHAAVAAIALAEGRRADAIRSYRTWYDESGCARCGLYELARVYDQAGQLDSVLAISARADSTLGLFRLFEDLWSLPGMYKRLGELYEQRADSAKAREYYRKFVDLWKDADPVLQPTVRDVRHRLDKLTAERP